MRSTGPVRDTGLLQGLAPLTHVPEERLTRGHARVSRIARADIPLEYRNRVSAIRRGVLVRRGDTRRGTTVGRYGRAQRKKSPRFKIARRRCGCYKASAIALPISVVSDLPPTSRVRGPSTRIASTASTIAFAASACPRCSSIIAPDQIWPTGLAMPLP